MPLEPKGICIGRIEGYGSFRKTRENNLTINIVIRDTAGDRRENLVHKGTIGQV